MSVPGIVRGLRFYLIYRPKYQTITISLMLTKIYNTYGSETKNSVIHGKSNNQKVSIIFLFLGTIQMGLREHQQKQWIEVQKRSTEFGDCTAFIVSGNKPSLCPKGNVTSSIKAVPCNHNPEKWSRQQAVRALNLGMQSKNLDSHLDPMQKRLSFPIVYSSHTCQDQLTVHGHISDFWTPSYSICLYLFLCQQNTVLITVGL